MKYLFAISLVMLLGAQSLSQKKTGVGIIPIGKWQIIENNYQGQTQSLAALTIATGRQFNLLEDTDKTWLLRHLELLMLKSGTID